MGTLNFAVLGVASLFYIASFFSIPKPSAHHYIAVEDRKLLKML